MAMPDGDQERDADALLDVWALLLTADVPDLHLPRPAWHQNAACRGHGPDVFFPTTGKSLAPARDLCAGCPVAEPCLDDALDHGVDEGMWGGLTPAQRRGARDTQAPRVVASVCVSCSATFESKIASSYCSGRCRMRAWRDRGRVRAAHLGDLGGHER
jgi:WhiB family redox-sensing transcriptional regulator